MLQVKAWQIDLALMHFGRSKLMCTRIVFSLSLCQGSLYASDEVDNKILFADAQRFSFFHMLLY